MAQDPELRERAVKLANSFLRHGDAASRRARIDAFRERLGPGGRLSERSNKEMVEMVAFMGAYNVKYVLGET